MTSHTPPKPLAWKWKCHSCGRTYKIAVTHRCLNCSHRSCVGKTPTKATKYRVCQAEFDYDAWASIGELRRNRESWSSNIAAGRGGGKQSKLEIEGARMKRLIDNTHNCSRDCDYPSECYHVRYPATSQAEASPVESPTTEEVDDEDGLTDEVVPYETTEAKEWFSTNCESSDSDDGSDEEIDRRGELEDLAEFVRRGDSFLGDS
ncbi:hypothetical protein BKA56DRAFT_617544 [Ilyonectria sp. MPI-CAGE-AT-0026]|nr:hypothetical protein BKA56DRAFT_617544 [Ilyonectria sp. MPI-CAGE-AT-0026]